MVVDWAALGAHVRLQQHRRPDHPQRRLALYRRRQADAAGHPRDGRESPRDRADDLFQRAQGFRGAAAVSSGRRGTAADVLLAPEHAVLRGRGTVAADHGRLSRTRDRRTRPSDSVHDFARLDRDRRPAPSSMCGPTRRPGIVGVPHRGVELKLVPNAGKWEARLRGPNIMPGYWRRPDLTAAAFDEEGFYKIGDALKPRRARQLRRGLRVRRPRLRGFQTRHGNLGQRRTAAAGFPRQIRALGPRRRRRRP